MTQKQLERDTLEKMKSYSLIGFGDLLREEIRTLKITPAEMASILNVSYDRCAELFDPNILPTLDEILAFCLFFDKEIGDVININYSKLNLPFKDIINYMIKNNCSYSEFLETVDFI